MRRPRILVGSVVVLRLPELAAPRPLVAADMPLLSPAAQPDTDGDQPVLDSAQPVGNSLIAPGLAVSSVLRTTRRTQDMSAPSPARPPPAIRTPHREP
jgi:hypothetical protein